uniref:Cathepsin propeptide inhibitor domain-containing protein n=1 Tax=Heliothis virescens TaxID=7102 RepID=A0A2A4J3Q6_HELVI
MKFYVIVALSIALIQSIKCEDFGDDAGLFSYDEIEDRIDDEPKPIYKIADAANLFKKFVKDFNKSYKNDEDYQTHYKNFVENLKEINRINSDKEYSSTSDINLFSDLSAQERQLVLGGPA